MISSTSSALKLRISVAIKCKVGVSAWESPKKGVQPGSKNETPRRKMVIHGLRKPRCA